jgi:spore coat polysaccharide biosynthesis protein SpsF
MSAAPQPRDRVICAVQARMGSSRLPGKSLRPLAGRPLIAHVFQRAMAIRSVHQVVLATSTSSRDDALVEEAHRCKVPVVRGSEWDVLSRYVEVADAWSATSIVRVTGDCPLLCPLVAEDVIAAYRDRRSQVHQVIYAWNDTLRSGFPDGTDVEVFSRSALILADQQARHHSDREHVTRWMQRQLCAAVLSSEADWSHLKLSVDTQEDFDRVARILAHGPEDFSLAATLAAARRAGEL